MGSPPPSISSTNTVFTITGRGTVLIISAGTSDIPVAREALLTAGAMGNRVEPVYDIGVAGIHRLMGHRERIEAAAVLIVVAGMEGALPSVVAGMTASPQVERAQGLGVSAAPFSFTKSAPPEALFR